MVIWSYVEKKLSQSLANEAIIRELIFNQPVFGYEIRKMNKKKK